MQRAGVPAVLAAAPSAPVPALPLGIGEGRAQDGRGTNAAFAVAVSPSSACTASPDGCEGSLGGLTLLTDLARSFIPGRSVFLM